MSDTGWQRTGAQCWVRIERRNGLALRASAAGVKAAEGGPAYYVHVTVEQIDARAVSLWRRIDGADLDAAQAVGDALLARAERVLRELEGEGDE